MSMIKTAIPRPSSVDDDRPPPPITTKQMVQGLARLLAGREQIRQGLAFVPNRATRDTLDRALKDAIRDIIADITTHEGL